MTDLIEIKTADLTGEALNWAVAKALGLNVYLAEPNYGNPHRTMIHGKKPGRFLPFQERYMPSTDWAQGGPLIDKSILELKFYQHEMPETMWRGNAQNGWGEGPTPLIAACRALVASVLGDTVSAPKELLS